MTTTKSPKASTRPHRLTKIPGFTHGRKSVYHDNVGESIGDGPYLRIGGAGRSDPAGMIFHALGRGSARRLRKALRAAGFPSAAAESRFSLDNPER